MKPDFKKLEAEIQSGKTIEIPEFLSQWLKGKKRSYVNGEWKDSKNVFWTTNPATEEKLSEICEASKEDVENAVESARRAFETGEWRTKGLEERRKTIRQIGDLILEHRSALAILESLDTGKPIRESFEGDILRSATNFHFFADFIENEKTLTFKNGHDTHEAFREPLGVVVLITPWNLPLYLETWKIAPALLMGNSVILKPSELTPLTAAYFTEILESIGLPKGVFNLVHGFGENSAGAFLTSHSGIDAISFTGETSTGRAIMKSAAVGPTRVSFELGGKGANIVFDDADLDAVVQESLRSSFRNQGEICLALPRIYVQKGVYPEFLKRFVAKAESLRVGNPLNYQTEMGALIGKEHFDKVTSYLKRVEPPARFVTGGKRPSGLEKGYYLSPTVIEGVSQTHPVTCEEIFGPVVSVYSFDSEAEVIGYANETQYGLSCSIWTTNEERARRVASQVRSGLVWVNCWFQRDLRVPFGGQKRSGVGREGGKHSLDFFSEWKSVCYRGKV